MATFTVNTSQAEAGNNFHTIQAAINSGAVANGDTIEVAAGVYNENVNVTKSLTIVGMGDVDDVVIQGTFKANNGLAADASVVDFLKTATSYVPDSGTGVSINADNVTIRN